MSPRPKTVQSQDYDSSSSQSESLSAEDIYRLKRDRNNVAVKKSREKSRQKNKETAEKMMILREENNHLERRIEDLSQELASLKRELLMQVNGGRGKMPTNQQVEAEKINLAGDLECLSNNKAVGNHKNNNKSLSTTCINNNININNNVTHNINNNFNRTTLVTNTKNKITQNKDGCERSLAVMNANKNIMGEVGSLFSVVMKSDNNAVSFKNSLQFVKDDNEYA